jgi:hypothetical protein
VTEARWVVCLDTLAEHLAQQRRALAEGDLHAFTAFAPEPGLPPLPESLGDRARYLQLEADRLQRELLAAVTTIKHELARLPTGAPEQKSRFVDARG